jgi:hypothetical protein
VGIDYRLRTNITVILQNYCLHYIPQSLHIASFFTCRDLLFASYFTLFLLMIVYSFNVDSTFEVDTVFLGYINYKINKFSVIIMCYCS